MTALTKANAQLVAKEKAICKVDENNQNKTK
jgi:hypothetical protein